MLTYVENFCNTFEHKSPTLCHIIGWRARGEITWSKFYKMAISLLSLVSVYKKNEQIVYFSFSVNIVQVNMLFVFNKIDPITEGNM
jgi:hypothetical protein